MAGDSRGQTALAEGAGLDYRFIKRGISCTISCAGDALIGVKEMARVNLIRGLYAQSDFDLDRLAIAEDVESHRLAWLSVVGQVGDEVFKTDERFAVDASDDVACSSRIAV